MDRDKLMGCWQRGEMREEFVEKIESTTAGIMNQLNERYAREGVDGECGAVSEGHAECTRRPAGPTDEAIGGVPRAEARAGSGRSLREAGHDQGSARAG
eukprot:4204761-Pyramimonas_sp.AAC.1